MAVPFEIPVTSPVLSTVATEVSDEIQGVTAAGKPDPVSCEVLPLQKVSAPVIVGRAFTTTVSVVVLTH